MDSDENASPFTRPTFLISAGLIVVLAAAAIVLGLTRHHGSDDNARPTAIPTATSSGPASPVPSGTSASSDESVCGLGGTGGPETVAVAPRTEWKYQGALAYPTSSVFGPGKTAPAGFRFCYQRSAAGALFAAANAAVLSTSSTTSVGPWLDYFVTGSGRDGFLSSSTSDDAYTGARVAIAGYRVLNYTADMATVDLGLAGSDEGRRVYLSMIYHLVRQDGDWKMQVSDPSTPVDVANLPDLSGYTPWGASNG